MLTRCALCCGKSDEEPSPPGLCSGGCQSRRGKLSSPSMLTGPCAVCPHASVCFRLHCFSVMATCDTPPPPHPFFFFLPSLPFPKLSPLFFSAQSDSPGEGWPLVDWQLTRAWWFLPEPVPAPWGPRPRGSGNTVADVQRLLVEPDGLAAPERKSCGVLSGPSQTVSGSTGG